MTATVRIEAAGQTHVGLVRRRNEDAFYAGEWLFAVADGLGGHVAGDVASTTAIDVLRRYDRLTQPTNLASTLGHAISEANQALRRKTRDDPDLAGMGTTVVAMLWSGNAAVLANVGDSRAYLIRDTEAELTQVTEDHTYRHLVAHASDVPNLPEKLARFLDGRHDGRSPDLTTLRLQAGDRILLCSDGPSSYVPEEVMRSALRSSSNPTEAADRLVVAALDEGGHDNITVIVIDVL